MPKSKKNFAGAPKSRESGPTKPLTLGENLAGLWEKNRQGELAFQGLLSELKKIFLSKKSLETLPLPQIGLILENTPRSVIEENYPKLLEVLEKERKLTTVIRGGTRQKVQVTVRGLPPSQQTGQDAVRKWKFVNYTESDRIHPGDRFLTKACADRLARLIKNPSTEAPAPLVTESPETSCFSESTVTSMGGSDEPPEGKSGWDSDYDW